jgi:hypothetical protein
VQKNTLRAGAAPIRCELKRDSQSGTFPTLCSRDMYSGGEMGKPLAMDLRKRALAAVDAGISRRAGRRVVCACRCRR